MTDRNQREQAGRLLDLLESYEHLHLILSVAGDPARHWAIADLVSAGTEGADVAEIIEDLVRVGVLARHPDDALSLSADAWVVEGAAMLLRTYAENPLPILQALTSRSMARLRSATARTFADAFVVRRKDS